MLKNRKMIDLFSGAGGLTLGFVQNGFDPIETVEIWEPALETYNFNFNKNVSPKDITNSGVRNTIAKKWKNKIDLVIGGFPCQGFSLAGKRDINDPRNKLYTFTIDVIEKTKPELFILENVKGILSFKDETGKLVIDIIQEYLTKINYYCKYILLDSSNFGVPQKRERVIFLGGKFKHKKKIDAVYEKLKYYKEDIETTRNAIEFFENESENIELNHIFSKHTPQIIEKISVLKQGESLYKNYSDGWRRIHYDKPSPTVKENHGGVHIHPTKNRVLTPRELALLQSFPNDFIFKSTKSNILKQIGNAVPVKLANVIAKFIKQEFYT